MAHFILFLRQAKSAQGGGDHQAEIEGGDGVHGLIPLGKALEQGSGGIRLPGGGHMDLAPEQEAHKQHQQKDQQAGRERAARAGRNPHTGETIEIAAAKVPAFKPGKVLKDAIQ